MLLENEKEFEHPELIKFSNTFGFVLSIISLVFILCCIILILKFRNFSFMTTFSIHLSINQLSHSLSYIIPNPPDVTYEKTYNEFQPKLKALLHVLSLSFEANIFIIYFFMLFCICKNFKRIILWPYQLALYIFNWVVVGVFFYLYNQLEVTINALGSCRFARGALPNVINKIYILVVFVITIIFYILTYYVVKCRNYTKEIGVKQDMFSSATVSIIILLVVSSLKIFTFWMGESFIILLIDRIWEHLYTNIVFVVLGIGYKNILK